MGDGVARAAKPPELLLHLAAVTAPRWIDLFRKLVQSYKPEKTLTDGGEGRRRLNGGVGSPSPQSGQSLFERRSEQRSALLGCPIDRLPPRHRPTIAASLIRWRVEVRAEQTKERIEVGHAVAGQSAPMSA